MFLDIFTIVTFNLLKTKSQIFGNFLLKIFSEMKFQCLSYTVVFSCKKHFRNFKQ